MRPVLLATRMARGRKRGRPLHGILLLDKPSGGSSNHALQRAKRLFNAQKAGHTGSLDPLATGMLPICFGEATKLSGYLLDADKGYETVMQFGVVTDSADADGDVIERRDIPESLTEDSLRAICDDFVGPQEQIPPMVSAIKIDGKRLYTLAREGKTVERAPRAVTLHEVTLLSFDGSRARLRVRCSKGTYIRSLVTDIGERVGCGAHVAELRRTFVSPFESAPMLTLDQLTNLLESAQAGDWTALDEVLLPVDAGLAHLPGVVLGSDSVATFQRGQSAPIQHWLAGSGKAESADDERLPTRVYDSAERLIGLGEPASGSQIAPKRVLQWD